MRSLQTTVLVAILLTGSASCDPLPPTHESRLEGGNFTAGIITIAVVIEKCYLITPSNEVINFIPNDTSGDKYEFAPAELTQCRVIVKDLNQNDNGIWTLHSKSTDGNTGHQSYNITVLVPDTTEPEVSVEYLPAVSINTTLGTNHIFTVRDFTFGRSDRCILETPEGQRIDLKSMDRPDVVEVISHPDAACAVNMIVKSDDVVGEWMLISEGTSFSTPTERRLRFTIHVEETVSASVDEVTLTEGNDFYIRLENSIHNFDSCELLSPHGSRKYENDERFSSKCGFIVKEVTTADSGTWRIQYGKKILYTALVVLNVNGNSAGELPSLTWHRNDNIDTTLGPEDAVYCRLENPSGRVVFDSFGRCRIVVNRVTTEHDGDWKMNIGVPGGVFTKNYKVVVRVVERAHDTPVMTGVTYNKPIVIITCKATSRFPLKICKFRNPHGKILLATEGVGQGRFTFHGDGSSFTDDLYSHECGFQITNPIVEDQGFWRCALETEDAVHYGFLKVMTPWVVRDPEIFAGIDRVPSPWSAGAAAAAGTSATLGCSVPAALRYCFLRSTNGTVFNVDPGSQNYEGGGFPSGECGIRFPSLAVADSGEWSCHVGIDGESSIEELRTSFDVSVYDAMVARTDQVSNAVVVQARVHGGRQLEYCRFVRSDGLGLMSVEELPRYSDRSDLENGLCSILVNKPNRVERRDWTVVARLLDGEEVARIASVVVLSRPNDTGYFVFSPIWMILIATSIILIVLSSVIAPKKNRQWALQRASSIRSSFLRKPIPPSNGNNTACAA